MGDPELWARMQRVERLRHRAELLELASVDQPPAIRKVLIQLARQARRMAEHDCRRCQEVSLMEACGACAYREWALAVPPPAEDVLGPTS